MKELMRPCVKDRKRSTYYHILSCIGHDIITFNTVEQNVLIMKILGTQRQHSSTTKSHKKLFRIDNEFTKRCAVLFFLLFFLLFLIDIMKRSITIYSLWPQSLL